MISWIIKKLKPWLLSDRAFELFQRQGLHVTRSSFYSPIPDTRHLRDQPRLWDRPHPMPGIDFNVDGQMAFLEEVLSVHRPECEFPTESTGTPHVYYTNNGVFGFWAALTLHSMIRHYRPRKMIEVGSGNSTYVSARAVLMNAREGHPCELTAIEPFPNEVLSRGFPGLHELRSEPVEQCSVDAFLELRENDILFIDSSHVARIGSDVNFLYLEVLPQLAPGVVVHIHDILFPLDYPREWVLDRKIFWNEQYLLHAFLIFNREFEVLWCGSYMHAYHADRILELIQQPPRARNYRPGFSASTWFRRRPG